ncbi:CDP-diacylglycerol--serine O-phosphatidyltransferase [Aquitalea magnusonii]|uniref:CDP-diacylglycerol--serine O-phosphatidyltransferase n=2 Tax=Aquitalea magnusonii TaxID=332411 RepID=A0A3G9GNU2_9NEIS|nr:CDP-diacylglycerol--serine O-phosphatidyltransferase [Aquitalea magnusonii]
MHMAFLLPHTALEHLPRFALTTGEFDCLPSAADFRHTLLKALNAAQQRIYIAALYLEQDEAGQEVLAAIYAAKQRNPALDVRILVDWHRAQRGRIGEHSVACNAAWYREQASQHAVEVPIYGVPTQTRELFGVLHLKGFIIDELVIYSGASLNNVYLHKQDKYRFDRYHLIRNPALADCMASFMLQNICNDEAVFRLDKPVPSTRSIRKEIRAFRSRLESTHYHLPRQQTVQQGMGITPIVGLGKGNPLNRLILQLLGHAQHRLVICTPYFNFPMAVLRAINRALRRGVEVTIIVGDKTANDFFIPETEPFKLIAALPYLYEMNLRRFAKRRQAQIENGKLNLCLWKDGDNSYHLKGMWCDAQHILLTGNNMNPRAFRLDLENALLIHDPEQGLQSHSHAEQQNILRHTTRISHYRQLESVRSYPLKVRTILTRLSRVRIDRMLNLML